MMTKIQIRWADGRVRFLDSADRLRWADGCVRFLDSADRLPMQIVERCEPSFPERAGEQRDVMFELVFASRDVAVYEEKQ